MNASSHKLAEGKARGVIRPVKWLVGIVAVVLLGAMHADPTCLGAASLPDICIAWALAHWALSAEQERIAIQWRISFIVDAMSDEK